MSLMMRAFFVKIIITITIIIITTRSIIRKYFRYYYVFWLPNIENSLLLNFFWKSLPFFFFVLDSELPFGTSSHNLHTTVNTTQQKTSTLPTNSPNTVTALPTNTAVKITISNPVVTKTLKPTPKHAMEPVLDAKWSIRNDIKKRLGNIGSIDVGLDNNVVVLQSGNRSFDMR